MKNFSKKELVLLFTLAGIQFTHVLDFMIMMPLGPVFEKVFAVDTQHHSWLVASYSISAFVSAMISSMFIDRYDRKKVQLLVYTGFIIGTLACALSPGYWIFLIARIFTGFFGGIASAVLNSIVGDAIPNERRATAMGIVMSAFSVASVVGVPLGLFLTDIYSWHAAFYLIVGIACVLWVVAFVNVPSMTGHFSTSNQKKSAFDAIGSIAADRNQIKALLLTVMLMFGHFTLVPTISPFLVDNDILDKEHLKYMYLIGGLLTIVSSPLVGRLADKHSRAKIFTILSCCALFPIIALTNLIPIPFVYVMIVTGTFFVFASGRMIPMGAIVTSTVLPQHRGGFMSINSALQQLAAGVAAVLAGFIIKNDAHGHILNYNYVGYVSAFFSIVCIWLIYKIKEVDTGRKPVLN